MRQVDRLERRMGGGQHRGEFVGGFAFHAIREQHRAELEFAHAAVEHRAVERARIVGGERARAMRAAADFLDEAGAGERGVGGGVGHRAYEAYLGARQRAAKGGSPRYSSDGIQWEYRIYGNAPSARAWLARPQRLLLCERAADAPNSPGCALHSKFHRRVG